MEFFLISLSIPLIIETDCISEFQYNFKQEVISIPSVAAKLDTMAATTSFSPDFHKIKVCEKNTASECIQ